MGNDGFIRLANVFVNNEVIHLKELYLSGNMISCNNIIYLLTLLRIDSTKSFRDQQIPEDGRNDFIFPDLQILDLNSIYFSLTAWMIDNKIDDEAFDYLLKLLANCVLPEVRQIFLLGMSFDLMK